MYNSPATINQEIRKYRKIYDLFLLYSWFRASSLYINKTQQDATDAGIYYCKLTPHVSGVYRTHHQEYIKL